MGRGSGENTRLPRLLICFHPAKRGPSSQLQSWRKRKNIEKYSEGICTSLILNSGQKSRGANTRESGVSEDQIVMKTLIKGDRIVSEIHS